MKVKVMQGIVGPELNLRPGDIHDGEDAEMVRWCLARVAEPADAEAKKAVTAAEKAAMAAAKKKRVAEAKEKAGSEAEKAEVADATAPEKAVTDQ